MSDTTYGRALAAGVAMDHHETDLYIKDCAAAREIVAKHGVPSNCKLFRSQVDGEMWWDIPFAYEPGWAKAARAKAVALGEQLKKKPEQSKAQ